MGIRSQSSDFLLTVIAASLAGAALFVGTVLLYHPPKVEELWAIPMLIIVLGAFSLPVIALGLAIFGLPATFLLRRWLHKPWVGLIAVAWGGVGGKLMFLAVNHLVADGSYAMFRISTPDAGIIFGLPTGLVWWLLCRRWSRT